MKAYAAAPVTLPALASRIAAERRNPPAGTLTAHDRLAALLDAHSGRVPCQDPAHSHRWFSTDPRDRRRATDRCQACPTRIRWACAAAADETGERFGVWGGVDRTRRT